jgi:hypothetical protein
MEYIERPKSNGKDLDEIRAGLAGQIKTFHEFESQQAGILRGLDSLRDAPEPAPIIITANDAPAPAQLAKRSQREILAELAAMANVSVGMARKANRLARSGNANLITAALLQLMPISTALRSTRPPKANARIERWRVVAALVGGAR